MIKKYHLALAAGISLCATNVYAAEVFVDATVDLNSPSGSGSGFLNFNYNVDPFSVSEGDTLNLLINFLPGQSLSANSLSVIWALVFSDDSSLVNQTGTLTYINPTGALSSSVLDQEPSACCAHLGNYYSDGLTTGPGPFSFTGIRSQVQVNDYDNMVSRNYNGRGTLVFNGSGFAVQNVVQGAVPEPATWALLLIGFGFVGGVMRSAKRRKKVNVSYA